MMAAHWTPPPPPPPARRPRPARPQVDLFTPSQTPLRRPALDVFDRLDALRHYLDAQPVWATHVPIADVRAALGRGA